MQRSRTNPVVVTLFGHSYIHWVTDCMQWTFPNLGFNALVVDVRAVCCGGGTIALSNDRRCLYNQVDQVDYMHPDIVYVHAGENDLQHGLSVSDYFRCMRRFIENIIHRCHPRVVIVSQTVMFPSMEGMSESIKAANRRLSDCCRLYNLQHGTTKLIFWKHEIGIWGPNRLSIFKDGAHLNSTGRRWYMRSVRAAIGRALRS